MDDYVKSMDNVLEPFGVAKQMPSNLSTSSLSENKSSALSESRSSELHSSSMPGSVSNACSSTKKPFNPFMKSSKNSHDQAPFNPFMKASKSSLNQTNGDGIFEMSTKVEDSTHFRSENFDNSNCDFESSMGPFRRANSSAQNVIPDTDDKMSDDNLEISESYKSPTSSLNGCGFESTRKDITSENLKSPLSTSVKENSKPELEEKTVPSVKKAPVFGIKRSSAVPVEFDKDGKQVAKKIPKFSSHVIKKSVGSSINGLKDSKANSLFENKETFSGSTERSNCESKEAINPMKKLLFSSASKLTKPSENLVGKLNTKPSDNLAGESNTKPSNNLVEKSNNKPMSVINTASSFLETSNLTGEVGTPNCDPSKKSDSSKRKSDHEGVIQNPETKCEQKLKKRISSDPQDQKDDNVSSAAKFGGLFADESKDLEEGSTSNKTRDKGTPLVLQKNVKDASEEMSKNREDALKETFESHQTEDNNSSATIIDGFSFIDSMDCEEESTSNEIRNKETSMGLQNESKNGAEEMSKYEGYSTKETDESHAKKDSKRFVSKNKTKSVDTEKEKDQTKYKNCNWDRLFSSVISEAMSRDTGPKEEIQIHQRKEKPKNSRKLKTSQSSGSHLQMKKAQNISNEKLKPSHQVKKSNQTKKTLENEHNNKTSPVSEENKENVPCKRKLRSSTGVSFNKKHFVKHHSSDSEGINNNDKTGMEYNSPGTAAFKEKLGRILEKSYDNWVQCDSCSKWRKLPTNVDPVTLPMKWDCEMNENEEQNSCSAPEDDWNKTYVYVYNGYIVGSVVWARVPGTDWWPAMVDIDPDFQIHNWLDNNAQKVTYYNVTFFGDPVLRGWVTSKDILKFRMTDTHERFVPIHQKDLADRDNLKEAVKQARKAMKMRIEDRKKKFAFVNRYQGPFGKRQGKKKSNVFKQRQSSEDNYILPSVSEAIFTLIRRDVDSSDYSDEDAEIGINGNYNRIKSHRREIHSSKDLEIGSQQCQVDNLKNDDSDLNVDEDIAENSLNGNCSHKSSCEQKKGNKENTNKASSISKENYSNPGISEDSCREMNNVNSVSAKHAELRHKERVSFVNGNNLRARKSTDSIQDVMAGNRSPVADEEKWNEAPKELSYSDISKSNDVEYKIIENTTGPKGISSDKLQLGHPSNQGSPEEKKEIDGNKDYQSLFCIKSPVSPLSVISSADEELIDNINTIIDKLDGDEPKDRWERFLNEGKGLGSPSKEACSTSQYLERSEKHLCDEAEKSRERNDSSKSSKPTEKAMVKEAVETDGYSKGICELKKGVMSNTLKANSHIGNGCSQGSIKDAVSSCRELRVTNKVSAENGKMSFSCEKESTTLEDAHNSFRRNGSDSILLPSSSFINSDTVSQEIPLQYSQLVLRK